MAKATSKALRVSEVAALLDVAPSTVRGWINAGDLEAVRPSPRTTRVLPEQLDRFLAYQPHLRPQDAA